MPLIVQYIEYTNINVYVCVLYDITDLYMYSKSEHYNDKTLV